MNPASSCGNAVLFQWSACKRLFWGAFIAGLLFCCAVSSGCQKNLLQNAPKTNLPTIRKQAKLKNIPQELDGLHIYLSQDLWVRNHHWSAEREWEASRNASTSNSTPSINVQRWVFGALEQKQLLPEPVKSETAESPIADSKVPVSDHPKSDQKDQNAKPEPELVSKKKLSPEEDWSFNTLQNFLVRTGFQDSEAKTTSAQSEGKIAALKRLAEQDSLAGWNSTILWATLDPGTAVETLPQLEKIAFENLEYDSSLKQKTQNSNSQTVFLKKKTEKEQLKPVMVPLSPALKHAAVNAICLVLSQADAIPLNTKNRLTQLLQRPDISLELRSELYCGLARFMPPAEIPSLEQTLDSSDNSTRPPKTLRRAAIDACIIHGLAVYPAGQKLTPSPAHSQDRNNEFKAAAWPANIMQVRWDIDSEMRWKFGFWSVLIRHPDAESILTSQLRDADLLVQNKAIESLGLLGTETALELLISQTKRLQVSSRVSATKGLTPWGVQYLAPLKNDTSSMVRLTVAEGLSNTPSPEAALLLQSLVHDRNTEVQLSVVDSISHWPDELAIPLLLEGIQEGAYKTRRKSIIQLIDRTGSGGSISIEASRAERIAAVRKLIQEKQLPSGLSDQLMKHGLQSPHQINNTRIAVIQAHFQDVVNQPRESTQYHHAYQELSNITTNEITVLEKLILDTSVEIPSEIYSDLLPELNPNYAALNQLTSSQVSDRRKAAQELYLDSQKKSLSPVIVKRLRTLMTHEHDRLVWRIVMSSIAQDSYEDTAQLALLAINHNWPDIRILGCDYFGAHRLPQYAHWLMPLLNDKNKSVQLAAINALGLCHNPIAITGIQNSSQDQTAAPSLRALLTHSNARIRFQTVVALSRLGDIEGMQEMVRLSNDPLNSTRLDAIREMGNSGQTRFVEPMIQSAWTERNHATLKELLSSLQKLVPTAEQPSDLNPLQSHSEQAKIWMDWWQKQHSGSSTRLFTGR